MVLYFNLFVHIFITAKYPCLKIDMTLGTNRIVLLYAQYCTCESVASKSVVRVRLSVCLCCKYVLHTGAMYSVVRVCSFVCLCCLYCFIVCFVFKDTLFINICKIYPTSQHLSLRSLAQESIPCDKLAPNVVLSSH